jgi:hypothetical protein
MDLLKEIACDEFNFIENAVELCIMFCTGDFDRVNVNCNHYISLEMGHTFVKISCKLDAVASDLSQYCSLRFTPQNASTTVVVRGLVSAMNLARCRAIPSGVTLNHASRSIQIPSSYRENKRYRWCQYLNKHNNRTEKLLKFLWERILRIPHLWT